MQKKVFAERLQLARRQAGFRALKDFAFAINESVATCTSWEHRGSEPRYDTLVKICSTLNCSADYLLGISDTPLTQITQNSFASPNSTQSINSCTNCPFAESYKELATALAEIAVRGTK